MKFHFLCRWAQGERGGAAAIRPEHGVRALPRDDEARTVGARTEARLEPSAGNREAFEEWEGSDRVLVGWSHLGSLLFCMKKKKRKLNPYRLLCSFWVLLRKIIFWLSSLLLCDSKPSIMDAGFRKKKKCCFLASGC